MRFTKGLFQKRISQDVLPFCNVENKRVRATLRSREGGGRVRWGFHENVTVNLGHGNKGRLTNLGVTSFALTEAKSPMILKEK